MNRKVLLFLSLFIIVLSIVLLCLLCNSISYSKHETDFSYTEAEQIFEVDYYLLVDITQYLNSLENISHAYIESTDGKMTLRYGDKREITNKDAIDTISQLFERGYFKIRKTNNTVVFYRWKNPFGCFKGFAFSTDGTGELDIQFVTEQSSLNEANWYYYVSDYEEWRSN